MSFRWRHATAERARGERRLTTIAERESERQSRPAGSAPGGAGAGISDARRA